MDKNISIDWSELFYSEPYLQFKPDKNGYMFPHISLIDSDSSFFKKDNRTSSKYGRSLRNAEYQEFVEKFGITEDKVEKLNSLRSMYLTQIELSLQELERIDLKIQRTLKVFFYEAYQQILQSNQSDDKNIKKLALLRETVRDLYIGQIRHGIHIDYFLSNWLPNNEKWVPKPIHDSLCDALKKYIPIKSKVIDFITPIFKRLRHVETAKYYILIEESTWDESYLRQTLPGEELVRNKTYRKMKEAGRRNEILKSKYISDAIEVVKKKKKPREFYLTSNGNLTSYLNKDVQKRIGKNGNARRWLNENKEAILKFCKPD